ALSGVVDPATGVVRMSGGLLRQNGSFVTEYPLADELRELLSWPVLIANDANVGALACFRRMARKGELPADGSLLYIMAVESLWGFGAGVVIKGRLYTGARGAAGEVLHPRLLSRQPDLRELARRAVSGDAAAITRLLEELRDILEHFAALAMTIDADRVVLGGALAALGQPLQRLMGQLVAQSPGFGPYLADLAERSFVIDELWPDTLAVGAAELVLDDLFREPVPGQAGPLVQAVLRQGHSAAAAG
ncbi:MAG: ROK family protein, partial [Armatimonadetes bacterium]|nr:ROK family protein [Armatimonadota bacterium]